MDESVFRIPSPEEKHDFPELLNKGIELFIKRDDLIHPEISGNKWRKLKWNVENAIRSGKHAILTFGGAHSNHIAATAAAANLFALKSIGIIRGEDVDLSNPTLKQAKNYGMHIHPITRTEFRRIEDRDYMEELRHKFGPIYIIPQGGSNYYGVQGCTEIISELGQDYDRIFLAVGTATTLSGMAIANRNSAKIYGVCALKGGDFLRETVTSFVKKAFNDSETEEAILSNIELLTNYHFGGYAKSRPDLLQFMRNFYAKTNVKLEPIYTGKAAFALFDMADKLQLKNREKWLLVHSGGLQGIPAFEERIGEALYSNC